MLRTNKEHVLMSHKLAKILNDVKVDVKIDETKFEGFHQSLKDFLKKYEMYSLVNRIFAEKRSASAKATADKEKKSDKNQMGLF
jgi:5'-3' exonuclease